MKLNNLLYLSKSDRMSIVLLMALALGAVAAVYFFGNTSNETSSAAKQAAPVARQTSNSPQYAYSQRHNNYSAESYAHPTAQTANRFAFDPNTADSTQLLQLGLKPWQVRNVYRYRERGGIFRTADDFARLYGLTYGEFKRLKPYIRIGADYLPAAQMVPAAAKNTQTIPRDTIKYPVKLAPNAVLNIATADTQQLKKVPGIGSYFAKKIVAYRQRLGGFASIEQLQEIEGLPLEALSYLRLQTIDLKPLYINKLTLNQLKAHPYINFYQARDVIDYRRLHGDVQSWDQLRLLKSFPNEAIERLKPYVHF